MRGKTTRAEFVRRLVEIKLSETGETPAEGNSMVDYDKLSEERTKLLQQQTRLKLIIDKLDRTQVRSKQPPMTELMKWADQVGHVDKSSPAQTKDLPGAILLLRDYEFKEGQTIDDYAAITMIQYLENLNNINVVSRKMREYWIKHKPKAAKNN